MQTFFGPKIGFCEFNIIYIYIYIKSLKYWYSMIVLYWSLYTEFLFNYADFKKCNKSEM